MRDDCNNDFEDYRSILAKQAFDPDAIVDVDGKLMSEQDAAANRRERRRMKAVIRARARRAAKKAAGVVNLADAARSAKWDAAHPAEVAARRAKWDAANPDKVAEKRKRSAARVASRSYHRPFIAIDAEGQDFPGFDETDAQGNIYPLHRTILWAMGGWRRKHTAEAIADGASPLEGEECPTHLLYHDDRRPLHTDEIIAWLLEKSALYSGEEVERQFLVETADGRLDKAARQRGKEFPDGVNFVSYSFNYDATQIMIDMPREKVLEITRKKSITSGKRLKAPVFYQSGDGILYAIDFLKGKWLKIWQLRSNDPKKAYKEKLDRNGDVKLRADGKPEREFDSIAYIGIDDAFGFYQCKFTTATKPLIKQGYIDAEDHKRVSDMKDRRDDFANLPMDEIRHYCGHLELQFLSKLLTVLRDGFDRMGEPDAVYAARMEAAKKAGQAVPARQGLRLKNWSGAGAAAGAKIRHEELNKKHYSPDISVARAAMTPWQEQAHLSFVGGRIEPIKQGYAMLRELFLYDVVSCYPYEMIELPSMRDGGWIARGCSIDGQWHEIREVGEPSAGLRSAADASRCAEKADARGEIGAIANSANVLSMFRVKWKFPGN